MFERLAMMLGQRPGATRGALFASAVLLLSCGGAAPKADAPARNKVAKVTPAPLVKLRPHRLFAGAPPVIPHDIDDTDSDGECMDCHEDGGAAGDDEIAPMVAHPQLVNCRQCHVPQVGKSDLVALKFQARRQGYKGDRLFATAPPTIPHVVGPLRVKCVACHAGPAPRAVKTTHPERTVCRQCHVGSTPD